MRNKMITVRHNLFCSPLPSLIVWELIRDYRYRVRNSRDVFSELILGLPLPTLILPELMTMTVTITDTDANLLELDR